MSSSASPVFITKANSKNLKEARVCGGIHQNLKQMVTAHEVQDGANRVVHAGYLRNHLPCPVCFRTREHIKLCEKGTGLVIHFRVMHKEHLTNELIKESSFCCGNCMEKKLQSI